MITDELCPDELCPDNLDPDDLDPDDLDPCELSVDDLSPDDLCPEAVDLVTLFTKGISASDGDNAIYRKGVALFSEYVSDDMEYCIVYAINNGVAVWDFYGEHERQWEYWSPQVNDLWVTYLIQQADAKNADIAD
ncbi:MAG: hypothetical protein WCK64_07240 [Synechococcaceae cyanobacterium ELA445]